MTTYYFLAAALPELAIGEPPEISFHVLSLLLRLNLKPADLHFADVLRRFYDITNVRAFWREKPLEHYGTLSENDLEEAILTGEGLPEYVYDFLEKYVSPKERFDAFPNLLMTYFREEMKSKNWFVQTYLRFEWECRLVLMAMRAKQMQRDVSLELHAFDDPLVSLILAQKDAKRFEPPERFSKLKTLFSDHCEDPKKMHQALCEYRFKEIEKMYGIQTLSLDRILAYMMQLILVEKYLQLDKEKGLGMIDEKVRKVQ